MGNTFSLRPRRGGGSKANAAVCPRSYAIIFRFELIVPGAFRESETKQKIEGKKLVQIVIE